KSTEGRFAVHKRVLRVIAPASDPLASPKGGVGAGSTSGKAEFFPSQKASNQVTTGFAIFTRNDSERLATEVRSISSESAGSERLNALVSAFLPGVPVVASAVLQNSESPTAIFRGVQAIFS